MKLSLQDSQVEFLGRHRDYGFRDLLEPTSTRPTGGSETGKQRPAIVVTNDTCNERAPGMQVAPITEWVGLAKQSVRGTLDSQAIVRGRSMRMTSRAR